MTCLYHGLDVDPKKIEDSFFVCRFEIPGRDADLRHPTRQGSFYHVNGICGEVLHGNSEAFFHNISKYSGLGDEIMLTAFYKYIKQKFPERPIYHVRNCNLIDPIDYYPDGLVTLCNEDEGYEKYSRIPGYGADKAYYSNWMWAPYLRDRGIYTEVKQKMEPAEYDVVYCPMVSPPYNFRRAHGTDFIKRLWTTIRGQRPNSVIVIDKKKAEPFEELEGLVVSDSFARTFQLIRQSRFYVGGDSGVSHYAGAVKHPRMVLIYGDQWVPVDGNESHLQKWYANIYREPDLKNEKYLYDARPCCPPENFKTIFMENSQCDVDLVLSAIAILE